MRAVPAGEQAADDADAGLEHLQFAVDVEIQMIRDPADTFVRLGVEAHHVKRVERFNDGETERRPARKEERLRATAYGLDLILPEAALHISAPCPCHLRAHVLRERLPILLWRGNER